MVKKILSLFLASVLLICAAGCGARRQADADGDSSPQAAVKTVSAKDVEMEYTVFGSGKKSFIILPGISIHSVMGSADAIAAAYSMFAQDYTVYVFDPPKNIREGYTVRDMADDTAEAMKALKIKNAYIFGASQGAMMAMYIAIDNPKLVNRIVLGSTLPKPNGTCEKIIGEWSELARNKDETGLLESFADNVYSQATLDAYRDVLISSNRGITDEEYSRFLIQADACRSFDCSEDLRKIKCPVLVLGSEGDRIVSPEGSREIAEILGCEIYLYDENYGHGVYDEAPDYKQRLMDFFEGR